MYQALRPPLYLHYPSSRHAALYIVVARVVHRWRHAGVRLVNWNMGICDQRYHEAELVWSAAEYGLVPDCWEFGSADMPLGDTIIVSIFTTPPGIAVRGVSSPAVLRAPPAPPLHLSRRSPECPAVGPCCDQRIPPQPTRHCKRKEPSPKNIPRQGFVAAEKQAGVCHCIVSRHGQ